MKTFKRDKVLCLAKEFVPGFQNPDKDMLIVDKMKREALLRVEQRKWKSSLPLLLEVLRCQTLLLGPDHPQVANILYHTGVVNYRMGNMEYALNQLEKAAKIIYPTRYTFKNMDLAAIFYQIGMIYRCEENFEMSLHYLGKQSNMYLFLKKH